jgi:hypothetical protein
MRSTILISGGETRDPSFSFQAEVVVQPRVGIAHLSSVGHVSPTRKKRPRHGAGLRSRTHEPGNHAARVRQTSPGIGAMSPSGWVTYTGIDSASHIE